MTALVLFTHMKTRLANHIKQKTQVQPLVAVVAGQAS